MTPLLRSPWVKGLSVLTSFVLLLTACLQSTDIDVQQSIEAGAPPAVMLESPESPSASGPAVPIINLVEDDTTDSDVVITGDNSATVAFFPEDESRLRRPRRPFTRRVMVENLRAALVHNRCLTAHQSMEFMVRLQTLAPAGGITTLTNVVFDVRRNQYRNNGGLIQRRGALDVEEQ